MKKGYEKERGIAKSILQIAPHYANFPIGQQKAFQKRVKSLERTTLGFIMEGMDVDFEYSEFQNLIEDAFIDTLATNGRQRHFLKESLENNRLNHQRKLNKEEVTLDTFNYGKHCDKFNRRKSSKKSKGKCFARIRVKEVSFY